MADFNAPSHAQGGSEVSPPYHVVPDNVRGGWNVYATHKPQEPQRHFETKEEAIAFAERVSGIERTGFMVEDTEAPSMGH
jgi:hypothetical protein